MSLELLRKLNSVGLMKQLSPAIGVDFGVSSLKLIQVQSGPVPTLIAAAMVDTPDEFGDDHARRLDFQLAQLPQLIRKGGFRGKRVICSLPSWQLFCKHLQVQRIDGVPMHQVVGAAVGQQIGCDPGALVLRHREVSAAGSAKVEVIVNAAARSSVQHMVNTMRKSGLEPVGMHSEFAAAMKAFEIAGGGDQEGVALYLDFGAHTTKAMIGHGKSIVFERVIEVGGRQLDRAVAKQLRCPLAEARRSRLALERMMPEAAPAEGMALLKGADTPVESDSEVNLREPLEILADEIRMGLRYHDGLFPGKRIDQAIFLGGESRQQAFSRAVAMFLGINTKLADPLAKVARTGTEPSQGVDLKQPQPGFGVAVGLCHCPADL
ncbi:MAG: pilus assembly protein PilM [Phycisphaeraceae bacterium]|nr:pilus assembly protein PilM [Phycisphaeraceae bacterium]